MLIEKETCIQEKCIVNKLTKDKNLNKTLIISWNQYAYNTENNTHIFSEDTSHHNPKTKYA